MTKRVFYSLAIVGLWAASAYGQVSEITLSNQDFHSGGIDKSEVAAFTVPVFDDSEVLSVSLGLDLAVDEATFLGVAYQSGDETVFADQVSVGESRRYTIDLTSGVRAALEAGATVADFSLVTFGSEKSAGVRLGEGGGEEPTVRYVFMPAAPVSREAEDNGVEGGIPGDYSREAAGISVRAVPNPFNPEVAISFDMLAPGSVKIRIYDIRGRFVASIYDGFHDKGRVVAEWRGVEENGERAASGVYFYRVDAARQVYIGKVMLLK